MLKLAHIVAHQGSSFACASVNSIWLQSFVLEAPCVAGNTISPQPRCDDKMMPSMFGVRVQVIARLERISPLH